MSGILSFNTKLCGLIALDDWITLLCFNVVGWVTGGASEG